MVGYHVHLHPPLSLLCPGQSNSQGHRTGKDIPSKVCPAALFGAMSYNLFHYLAKFCPYSKWPGWEVSQPPGNASLILSKEQKYSASDRYFQCYFMYLSKVLIFLNLHQAKLIPPLKWCHIQEQKSRGIIGKSSTDWSCASLSLYLAISLNDEKGKNSMCLLLGHRKHLVCLSFKVSNNNSLFWLCIVSGNNYGYKAR